MPKKLDTQVLLDPLANAVCKVRQWATAANSYCWSETLAACRSSHPTHARLNHKLKLTVTSSNTYSDFHPIAFRSLWTWQWYRHFPLCYPTNINIRFKFHAIATSFIQPLTFSNPRNENWRNPITDLTMPIIGSTVLLRCASISRPAFVWSWCRIRSIPVAFSLSGGGSVKRAHWSWSESASQAGRHPQAAGCAGSKDERQWRYLGTEQCKKKVVPGYTLLQ